MRITKSENQDSENSFLTPKRQYQKPQFEKIRIDNQISIYLQSEPPPPPPPPPDDGGGGGGGETPWT